MIKFTEEHMTKLKDLAVEMLLNNGIISTTIGQVLNISDLLHTTTINTLKGIKISLSKKIENLELVDEWVEPETQKEIENLKRDKELVNLIIGYKRFQQEEKANAAKKHALEKQLKELEESTKTPAEKIAEIKEQLNALS